MRHEPSLPTKVLQQPGDRSRMDTATNSSQDGMDDRHAPSREPRVGADDAAPTHALR